MKKLPILLLLVLIGCQKDPFADSNNGTFKDSRDQQEYKWVRIGEQIWMAENLAFLPSVNQIASGSETEKFYYVYGYNGNDVNEAQTNTNYQTYGVLYNWPAAMVACPSGWHLSSDMDWNNLGTYLTSDVGKKLKGISGWLDNGNGDNSTGFDAVPGGAGIIGSQSDIGKTAFFWTSTISDASQYWYRYLLGWSNDGIYHASAPGKSPAFSVRCLKD
jgi:uncharacterized protein (TIGR02145 family)